MVTAIKVETKYNCLCGYGTNDLKAYRSHTFTMSQKEKGMHKSINPQRKKALPFVAKENPGIPKTPLEKLQAELAAINQKAAEMATAIEKEAEAERLRREEELRRQEEAKKHPEVDMTGEVMTWQAKKPNIIRKSMTGKILSSKTACIIIDHKNHWHTNELIDLKGNDTSDCTWGYYGKRYPVLVEKNGVLTPYSPEDSAAGESPHRLYIAAKSSAYKSYMHIDNEMLKKIQVGLMALLVFGILFLIYIVATTKPAQPADTVSAMNLFTALLGV